MKPITIGLFGTCGSSNWREPFIEKINKTLNATYFNPQLPEGTWTPDFSDIENQHFKSDDIILFPVTNETCGVGSLSEIGFSISSILENLSYQRFFVFMIDDDCLDNNASENQRNESIRTRALVKSKVSNVEHSNVFIVSNLIDLENIMAELIPLARSFGVIQEKYKLAK
jgi:hypothetical protein